MRYPRAFRGARMGARLGAVALVVLLVAGPSWFASSGVGHAASASGATSVSIGTGPFTAAVTWNGANVSHAGSPSSAFSVGSGQVANVTFRYTSVAPVNIANASLVLSFLGLALTTNTVPFHTTLTGGVATVNWSFGPLAQLTVGAYQLDAKIVNSTGSNVWSESFYIDVKAPYYGFGAGIPAFLIVLALAEAYWIGAAIRSARRRVRKSGGAQPSTAGTAESPPTSGAGPATSSAPPSDSSPATGSDASSAPPSPPSSGGSA